MRVCPTCKRVLPSAGPPDPFRPFCGERCRLADLGSWLNENFRISSGDYEDDVSPRSTGGEEDDDSSDRRHDPN